MARQKGEGYTHYLCSFERVVINQPMIDVNRVLEAFQVLSQNSLSNPLIVAQFRESQLVRERGRGVEIPDSRLILGNCCDCELLDDLG